MSPQGFHHICTAARSPSWALRVHLSIAQGPLPGNTHSFCEDAHEFRELVCQEGQHGCEGAQSRREEDEEGELLLGVNWDFMKSWGDQRGAIRTEVGAFYGCWCPLAAACWKWNGRNPECSPAPICPCCPWGLAAPPKPKFHLQHFRETHSRVTLWVSHTHEQHLCLIYSVPIPKANTEEQNPVQITKYTSPGKFQIKCECARLGLSVLVLLYCILNHYRRQY